MDANDKIDLPIIGFGTYPRKEELVEAIPWALEAGYRLVDTSDNYHNEEWVGKGLATVPSDLAASTVVVTKFSMPMQTHRLRQCFAESREKLGGKVDLYLLHWPYPFLWREQWRRMERLVENGEVAAIGVCNFDFKRMQKLLDFAKVKPAVNQLEVHPLFQQRAITDYCRENGIAVMCYSPLARRDPSLVESPVIGRIADAHGKTPGQVVLRWNVEHGFLPIPASALKEHIEENFSVQDFSLSEEEIAAIDALECGKRIRFAPDKRFSTKQKAKFLLERIAIVLHLRK